ncbi:DUF4476 domain-containing protein [Flavitalea flava]
MKRLFLLTTCLLLAVLIQAQNQPVANLTIFSEDGDKFFLILNGEKQNTVAQSNIRIEELPQPYYNAKIIFDDATLGTIAKANLMVAGQDGTMMDVTYKIRKDKAGKVKINYYSAIAVQQNFIPPTGMYVHQFGRQDAGGNTAITTSTTKTTIANPQVTSVTMNAPGMNVTINQPVIAESTTVTTTSTSGAGYNQNNGNTQSSGGNGQSSGCNGYPMAGTDFAAAKKTIAGNSFEDSKLSSAKTIASTNCLCVTQIMEICKLFGFEESKLAFAKFAYSYSTDPKNYFKVVSVFSFDASKEELNHFMAGN